MIAITGVTGLVGANLARALLAQGRQVRGTIHHERRPVAGLDIELVQADVRDPESLRGALAGADVVYHLAARISLEMDRWPEVEAVHADIEWLAMLGFAHSDLGASFEALARYDEAMASYRRTLEIRERVVHQNFFDAAVGHLEDLLR